MESKTTLKELVEPFCQRVQEAGNASRHVRALNPLSTQDAELLQIVSDPKWSLSGLRNRDILARLYPDPVTNAREQRSRSARVTRLIRLLRSHGILEKVPHTHRYQLNEQKRANVHAVLLARDLSPVSHLQKRRLLQRISLIATQRCKGKMTQPSRICSR